MAKPTPHHPPELTRSGDSLTADRIVTYTTDESVKSRVGSERSRGGPFQSRPVGGGHAPQRTPISSAKANGETSSRRSPLQKRPGSYQLAGRRLGSRPMCWEVVATRS